MKLSFFSLVVFSFFFSCLPAAQAAGGTAQAGSRFPSGKLQPPKIIEPAEIAQLRGVDHVTFRWREVRGATGYHIVLATDRSFKDVFFENTDLKNTSYTVRNLNYGTYFLKISSVSADGKEGPFSHRLSFIVVPPPPQPAVPILPQELKENNQSG